MCDSFKSITINTKFSLICFFLYTSALRRTISNQRTIIPTLDLRDENHGKGIGILPTSVEDGREVPE